MLGHERKIKFALAKARAMLETVSIAREVEFPYQDPSRAIDFIHAQFENHLGSLLAIDERETFDPATADNYCKRLLEEIDQYLLAVGFLQRACDTSCPFEFHAPFATLTKRALKNSPSLVISLDWSVSPFTLVYPNQFGDQFVLVGLPASEIGNPLVFPLAGHELGHNVWRYQRRLQSSIGQRIKEQIDELVKGPMRDAVTRGFQLNSPDVIDQPDLFQRPWDIAHSWSVAQAEEVFCDFFGLFMFGPSYLHAFEYLLSPGGGARNPLYPSMKSRIRFLAETARRFSIDVDADYEARFEDSETAVDPRSQLLLALADSATRSLAADLAAAVEQYTRSKSIYYEIAASELELVEKAFKDGVPATRIPGVAPVLNAAWRLYVSADRVWPFDSPRIDHQKRLDLLKELVLKSFEVLQLEQIFVAAP